MLTVLGYVAVGVAAVSIAGHLPAWLAVRRVYGRVPVSLVLQMLAYARRAPAAGLAHGLAWVVAAWLGLEAAHAGGYLAEPPRLLLVGAALFLADGLATCALPPSVLFLASSDPKGVAALSRLCEGLWPHSAVALLRPASEWPDPATRGWFFLGCLRTGNTYEWRSEVFHLMDVVPLIVLDLSAGTAGLDEEWTRLVAKGYLGRTVQLTGPLDAGQVEAIRSRLGRPEDLEERLRRQAEFTALVGLVPPHVRFDRGLYALVARSRWIEGREYERFLRRCKGLTPSQVVGRLVEDLPSVVPAEEEARFLRESRAYEEVDLLLRSALEAVAGSTEPSAPFNVANCHNNLGKLARLRRRWDEALGHLGRAVEGFGRLAPSPAVRQEIATAHYHLGEVYLARSRATGDAADKAHARDHLERSLVIDRALGADGDATRRLLRAIDGPVEGDLSATPPDAHRLREPTFWENPTVGLTAGVVAAMAAAYPAILFAGWLLGMPADWLSPDGWEAVSGVGRIAAAVVAAMPCLLVLVVVVVALGRD